MIRKYYDTKPNDGGQSSPTGAGTWARDWNVYEEYQGEMFVHNGMHLPKCLHPKTIGILFAEFIADGNYEYETKAYRTEFTQWGEVEDPQFHGEDGAPLLTTNQLFTEFFKCVKKNYPELVSQSSPVQPEQEESRVPLTPNPNKPFIVANVRTLLECYEKEQYSFSRMVEIMNEMVTQWLAVSSPSSQSEGVEWISVKDRLPEFPKDPYNGFSERVLAFDGSVMKVVSLFKSNSRLGLLGYNTQQADYMHNITHWLPLPSPPKQ